MKYRFSFAIHPTGVYTPKGNTVECTTFHQAAEHAKAYGYDQMDVYGVPSMIHVTLDAFEGRSFDFATLAEIKR